MRDRSRLTVSTMAKCTTKMMTTAAANMTTKMACQPASSIVRPPIVGAKAGPTPSIRPIRFMMRAERSLVNRSRTMAREMATPTAAPTPCRKRAAMRSSIVGATSASSEATR